MNNVLLRVLLSFLVLFNINASATQVFDSHDQTAESKTHQQLDHDGNHDHCDCDENDEDNSPGHCEEGTCTPDCGCGEECDCDNCPCEEGTCTPDCGCGEECDCDNCSCEDGSCTPDCGCDHSEQNEDKSQKQLIYVWGSQ